VDAVSMTDALADRYRIHKLRLAIIAKHRDLYGFTEYHGHVARTCLKLAMLRAVAALRSVGR
jgi:hypothetical protein